MSKLTPSVVQQFIQEDGSYPRNFEKDVEEAFEFAHLPDEIKNRIHSKAWSDGHSAGYHEVIAQYYDLVDLAVLSYNLGQKR